MALDIGKLQESAIWVKCPGKDGDEYLLKYVPDTLVRLEVSRDEKRAKDEMYDMYYGDGWVIRILARGIIDWRGITRNGVPVECTDEAKMEILPLLKINKLSFLLEKCTDESLFLGYDTEEDLKN